jgi:hypothetical protein
MRAQNLFELIARDLVKLLEDAFTVAEKKKAMINDSVKEIIMNFEEIFFILMLHFLSNYHRLCASLYDTQQGIGIPTPCAALQIM